MKPTSVLKDFFGYDHFRGNQESIIENVLSGKDTIGLMPTGAGKSVCYQVPAMLLPGLTLVISPLIALMKDQVDALNSIGIPAAFLNSTQSSSEQRFISEEVISGKLKLLYVAPERIFSGGNSVLELLESVTLSLVAVDEAQACVLCLHVTQQVRTRPSVPTQAPVPKEHVHGQHHLLLADHATGQDRLRCRRRQQDAS